MMIPDFLTQNSDGEICLSGHRIGLYHLVNYYNEGYSPEMLAGQFPTLTLALIHKVIAFYLENQTDVDEYVSKSTAMLDQQRNSDGRHLDVDALRKRMEAMQSVENTSQREG